jgi:hypothetical protein
MMKGAMKMNASYKAPPNYCHYLSRRRVAVNSGRFAELTREVG